MAKPNYSHARRQREAQRKARQDERLARRQPKAGGDEAKSEPAGDSSTPPEPAK